MISKNEIKVIRALHRKKGRIQHSKFVVEGEKLLIEAENEHLPIEVVFTTDGAMLESRESFSYRIEKISNADMAKVSALSSPSPVLTVLKKEESTGRMAENVDSLTLMLDGIRDPGNLGTILRTADWFGVKRIIASEDTVDVYNQKVLQSSMGSAFRVMVDYTDLPTYLNGLKKDLPVYAAVLDGQNTVGFFPIKERAAVLVMGSESHGISPEVLTHCNSKITIPKVGDAESLNVAIATSLMLYEWKRASLRSSKQR